MPSTKKIKSAKKTKDKKHVATLSQALFTDNGKDKDVTQGIASAFLKYDRQGCDFEIKFSAKLTPSEAKWAYDLTKANMESVYDASGYGWSDEDKHRELTEPGGRFLLVRERSTDPKTPGQLVGFCHFRFTVQGDVMDVMVGDPCIYVWDVHVEERYQRKGVGKHLLTLLSLIGSREKMMHVCVPIQMFDDRSQQWIESIKGFAPDKSLAKLINFDAEMEGFEVFTKQLAKPKGVTPSKLSPPDLTVPSPSSTTAVEDDSQKDSDVALKDDLTGVEEEYDIVTKEEVQHVNAEGEEESEEMLNQDEVLAGLKAMFSEKHGREATPDEVKQWLDAISGLKSADMIQNNAV